MTPQTVCLRADPKRVRVAVRYLAFSGVWRVMVGPRGPDFLWLSVERYDADPTVALSKALAAAAKLRRWPGIDLDGADYPHPQRRAP